MPGSQATALSGNRFQVDVKDFFLTGEGRGESGTFELAESVGGSGQHLLVAPGVQALGVVEQPDILTWVSDREFPKHMEVAEGTTAMLYFSANVQALAVFRVRVFDLEPDGTKHLLAADEQQFVTALDPSPVAFHLQTAGGVIRKGGALAMEVQAQTTQGLVTLQYGGGAPSGLRGLGVRWLDSDGDGRSDSDEELLGTNPLAQDFPETDGTDSDDDGIPDDVERRLGLDPRDADTDDDGYLDGVELHAGSDPRDPASTPVDEDGDGLPDAFELNFFNTTNVNGPPGRPGSPGAPGAPGGDGALDPDGDGCDNLCEAAHGTDPTDPDTDDDGILDGEEVDDRTNPLSALSHDTLTAIPEPIAAAAAFALGTTLVLVPLVRRP